MSSYIFVLKPFLDSIKLLYPEEADERDLSLDFFKASGYARPVNCDLDLKEEADAFIAEWISKGFGKISFGKDGGLYVKTTACEMKNIIANTLNAIQERVKNMTFEDLISPSTRDGLQELIMNHDGIKIINKQESFDILTPKQWLYSEYDRILTESVYVDSEWDDLSMVYKITQVIKYDCGC